MTRCPVCGMEIDVNTAKKVLYNGRTYFVASDGCKARFEADPERYITSSNQSEHHEHSHKHGCC